MRLQLYILRVVGVRVLASAVILLAVLQILDLLEVTTDIINRGLGGGGVAYYAALRFPRLVEQVAPLSVLAGGLFAFAQLARENAVTTMRAVGVSAYRLLYMALPVAVAVLVIQALAIEVVSPRTDPALDAWWRSTAPAADRPALKAQPFRIGADLVTATAGDAAGRRLQGVEIFRRDGNGAMVERIQAPLATYDPGHGWRLHDPKIVRFSGADAMSSTASQLDWPVDLKPADVQTLLSANQTPSAASAERALSGGGAERPKSYYAVRLQRAFAGPFGILVMLLLTAPVALANFRTSQGMTLTAGGLGAGLAFLVVDGMLSALGESAALSPVLAAWTAPLVFAAFAITSLVRMEG